MKNKKLIILLSICSLYSSYAQFTNNGAKIIGKNNVIITSSMDINNGGEVQIEGELHLKGRRSLISESILKTKSFFIHNHINLIGDLMVSEILDFGENGFIKLAVNNKVTFNLNAKYLNYSNGNGIHGKVQKLDAKNFIFPLATSVESLPVFINESNSFVEATVLSVRSNELGDFNYNNFENPNMAVIELNSTSYINPNQVKLSFDEHKKEVILNNGIWTEANRMNNSKNIVVAKAMEYHKISAVEFPENKWVNVYPNPSNLEFNIKISEKDKEKMINFRLIDLRGNIILQERKQGKLLDGKYNLPANIATDSYLLEFEIDNNKRSVFKQLIIK